MPNSINLGPTVFTEWRAQQGRGGILRPLGIGENSHISGSITKTLRPS